MIKAKFVDFVLVRTCVTTVHASVEKLESAFGSWRESFCAIEPFGKRNTTFELAKRFSQSLKKIERRTKIVYCAK